MTYELTCLLCAATGRNHVSPSLVTIQEHAMSEHGYKQEDHQNTLKRELEPGHYIYTFPDGVEWLDAQRVGGNTLAGL